MYRKKTFKNLTFRIFCIYLSKLILYIIDIKMAKRPQRTQEQQEYRDKLAKDLKTLRTKWEAEKELAKALLDDQKNTPEYIVSKYGYTNKWAKQLIDAWHGSYLISNLYSFEDLDKEVAQKLLENGLRDELKRKQEFQEWQWFEKWDNEFAIKLIENWYLEYVWYALNNFEGLDKNIANKLTELPWIRDRYILMDNLDKFEWLDCNEFVEKLLESPNQSFLDQFDKLWWLNKKTANILMENRKTGTVFYHMDKFEWLDQMIVAKKMIEEWRWHEVAMDIHLLKPEYHKEIADELINSWNTRNIEVLLQNLNKYKWLNHQEIVDKLFEIWKWWLVDLYFNVFKGLNRKEILNKYIEYWLWDPVRRNLKEYEWLSNDVANELIKTRIGGQDVVFNLDRFEKLDDDTILKIINDNYNYVLSGNYGIPRFASLLIKNWYWKNVAENLDKFNDLDDETRIIIKERYWKK